jgi:hypothetical protein
MKLATEKVGLTAAWNEAGSGNPAMTPNNSGFMEHKHFLL